MKKIIVIITVLMCFSITSAQAHGPTRQTAVFKATIDANDDQVWAIIEKFDDQSWHPLVVSIDEAHDANKKGATRILTLKTGGQVTQVLKKYDPKKMLMKFKTPTDDMTILSTVEFSGQNHPIRTIPAYNYLDQIKVEKSGDDKSTLAWKATFFRGYTNNLTPGELPELNEDAAKSAIQHYVNAGLLAILKKYNQNATVESIESCFATNPKDCSF
jgi:mxaD protein